MSCKGAMKTFDFLFNLIMGNHRSNSQRRGNEFPMLEMTYGLVNKTVREIWKQVKVYSQRLVQAGRHRRMDFTLLGGEGKTESSRKIIMDFGR